MSVNEQPVIEVNDLVTEFHTPDGVVYAVNGVTFSLSKGEFLAVVGESGSGKSVTMMSLLKLIPMPPGKIVSGSVRFDEKNLLEISNDELRNIRGGEIGFIFQDPMTSLNPVLTIGHQIVETLELHTDHKGSAATGRAVELLEMVGIPDARQRLDNYPHELSGGMRQRVMIAIALACSPKVIVADEPTTALDVTIQAQIIEIVRELRDRLDTSVIWITHDLGVVAGLADRVVVMYGGRIVEVAEVLDFYTRPQHPYSKGLLASLPRPDQKGQNLKPIDGQPPTLRSKPNACAFAPRCDYVHARCWDRLPELETVSENHMVACFWDMENDRPSERVVASEAAGPVTSG